MEKAMMEKELGFNEAKARMQKIYGRMIPHVMELLTIMQEEGVEVGSIASINIDADGYIRIQIPKSGFYVYRFNDDDFTLSYEYSEKFGEIDTVKIDALEEDDA